ncbi:hypothetical protein PACTADRAFT_50819 [Pachysolen tannophilus NRRL Y-2460]|uniref:BRO domain-containing protein 1 n=1 Tax=Pachysolen tannophilus NRRL Y-2460 TaxID=669874 RepID=A0A1E4TT72_PACTA|nr:hypothetical protein PACTADRAFT_50819 [Pachysolen tannophilus NRRL Y-2460]
MKSQLLTIPSKNTDNLDWIHPLRNYLIKTYGNYQDFNEEINTFNKLRSDAKGVNKDLTGRDILYRYYGQLELFDLRIPVDANGGVNINFTWYDAFKESKEYTQHSLAFEKAGVLFNLASVLSHIASDASDKGNDYKTCYSCLQYAAGVLLFISENFLHAPSADLKQETVKALEKLMLAQAQEVFVLKLLDGETYKNSLVARLSKSTSNFYNSTNELLENLITEVGIPYQWLNHCKAEAKYFNALAYYHQALNLKDLQKIGEAISFMKESQEEIKEIQSNYTYHTLTTLKENIKTLSEKIKAELPVLEKDNDYIYHETIPAFASLAEIKALDSCKAVPINEQGIDKVVGNDIFEKIIPLSIHEQSSKYSEEKAKLLRQEDEKIVVSDEELKSILEYLNLPKALVDIKEMLKAESEEIYDDDNDILDPRIKDLAFEVSSNSIDPQKLESLKSKIYSNLQKIENALSNIKPNGDPNISENIVNIREKLINSKKSLLQAGEQDAKIESLIKPYRQQYDMLRLGPNNPQLLSFFRNGSDKAKEEPSLLDIDNSDLGSDREIEILINEVEGMIQDLYNLKKGRHNVYSEFQEKVHNDDISNILILNKSNISNIENELFQQELLKFEPLRNQIEANLKKQDTYIKNLKLKMSILMKNRKILKMSNSSFVMSKKITNFLKIQENDILKRYLNGLNAALKFYSDLSIFVEEVEVDVNGLVSESKSSASNSNWDILNNFQRLSVGSNSNVSPAASRSPSTWNNNNNTTRDYQSANYNPSAPSQPPLLPPKPNRTGSTTSDNMANYYRQAQPQQLQQPQQQVPSFGLEALDNQTHYQQGKPSAGSIYDNPPSFDPTIYSKYGN